MREEVVQMPEAVQVRLFVSHTELDMVVNAVQGYRKFHHERSLDKETPVAEKKRCRRRVERADALLEKLTA
jgi:hypothetical protein